ncbi:MAG: competence/damage-inducible protein A [Verrucomicrobiae bacterium]|nr:competence/damage-inducible protein A [Verrucomicrobiae bacterium]
MSLRLELINTGTELLLGKTLNTHLGFIADSLFPLGIRIARQLCVPDGAVIGEALRETFGRADVVLVTGGLGPTSDDITRELVAELLGRPLHRNEAIVAGLQAFFAKRGRPLQPENLRQADVPEGAEVLENPFGTAPGLYVPGTADTPHIFLLPGPPRELRPMIPADVLPRLRAILGDSGAVPETMRQVRLFGVGESEVANRLEAGLAALAGLEYGYCARPGEVELRFIGSESALDAAVALAKSTFPVELFAEEDISLSQAVVALLAERNQTLASAESCTGGLIASRITDVSGSSVVFHRGIVSYANEAKVELLGVRAEDLAEFGAVSEPVARQMAEGALWRANADHAVAVTGIAGPTGGSGEKPVGTVFLGLASARGSTVVEKHFYPTDRLTFKSMIALRAIDLVRRRLMGHV